jgi:AcrR family transcriptional regulator
LYAGSIAGAPPPARPRRTQAERRAETRKALLDATIDSLVTHGYAQTTTSRIAELAGVSRGAQTLYFRTRAELLGAAVVHLAEERVATVSERFAKAPVTPEQALDALWDEHQGRLFLASLELWVASRTDPELAKAMHRVEREVGLQLSGMGVAAFGDSARRPGFTDDLVFALATIRGLALLGVSGDGDDPALAGYWRHARGQLVELLSPAGS